MSAPLAAGRDRLGHLDAQALLALWEAGVGQPASAREDSLLRATSSGGEPPNALGERNAQLLGLHARLFGNAIDLLSHCPGCGAAAQFTGDCEALSATGADCADCANRPAGSAGGPIRIETAGYSVEFRLPDANDIAAVSHASGDSSEDEFAHRLLARCVLSSNCEGRQVPVDELPEPVVDALSREMEALDPRAALSFAVACPQCGVHWDAPLDLGRLVWQKVQAAAERLLLDVDTLARTYGWTESEVLRLSPTRRAAYLQLAAA